MLTTNVLSCNVCNKQYKTRSGLWKHSQICGSKPNCDINTISDEKKVSMKENGICVSYGLNSLTFNVTHIRM